MSTPPVVRRAFGALLIGAIALGVAAAPRPAQAWWRGGYGWGGWHGGVTFGFVAPPIYLGPPPVYYAAPAYPAPYYAPPAYAPPPYPPAYAAPTAAQGCYAGPYVCPLNIPAAIGGPCSCPANNGRVYGRAG